jgi:mono/diheme cytochrome c family protein
VNTKRVARIREDRTARRDVTHVTDAQVMRSVLATVDREPDVAPIGSCIRHGREDMTIDMLVRVLRAHSFTIGVLLLIGVGATALIAAARELSDASSCAAECETPAVAVPVESADAQAVGGRLFQGLGCIDCHRPDGKGAGPVLAGLFGRAVSEAGCGIQVMDDAYVREAILNPSATVAAGFPPIMPSFAGRLTEEDLQALIAYLKSLSAFPPVGKK